MKDKDLTESQLNINEIYHGHAVNFRVDDIVLPVTEDLAKREFMDHPGAVAVLPVLPNGDLILVKQFRYPINQVTLEIPAGKLHRGKDNILARAKAELKEETGYTAGRLIKVTSMWPSPAYSNEVIHIFIARELKAGIATPDEGEFVRVVQVPYWEARRMINAGKIRDAKTIIAIMGWGLK